MRIPTFDLEDRLLKARTSAGMSQSELADRLGMSRSSFSRYEQGQRVPPPKVLAQIAAVTGVDLKWLSTGEVPETPIQEATIRWTPEGIVLK